MYWLLAFGVLGNTEQLADALAYSDGIRHPAIVALRTHLAAGRDLLSHRKRTWPARKLAAMLAEIRERVG
jgi:hypothetical protein